MFKEMGNRKYYKPNVNNGIANTRNSWQLFISGSFYSIVIVPFSHSQYGIKCDLMLLKNDIFLKKVKKRTRSLYEYSSFDRIFYIQRCLVYIFVFISHSATYFPYFLIIITITTVYGHNVISGYVQPYLTEIKKCYGLLDIF